MALADSVEAIGAVSELLQTQLTTATTLPVDIGRPELSATSGSEGRKFNLFLYRIGFDPHLRDFALDVGQTPPLWLTLHYLITAFDAKESDSIAAHRLLGRGLATLNDLNFVRPPGTIAALAKNPEPLKITFDEADVELLSKLMQGSDEKYRLSAAFQVRPVMVKSAADGGGAPLVKSVGPFASPGVIVLPSLGPRIAGLQPEAFQAGDTLTLLGSDVEGYDEFFIGTQTFPVDPTSPLGERRITLPVATTLAAGAYPIYLGRLLPSGQRFTSEALLGHLRPTVTGVTAPAVHVGPKVHGTVTINGRQLGGANDNVIVALFGNGKVAATPPVTIVTPNTSISVTVPAAQPIDAAKYAVVVRVNGEQAADAPEIDWQ